MPSRVSSRPKVLVLCHTVPYPADGGVWIRTYNVLRLLAEHFEITMLCFERVVPREQGATHDLSKAKEGLGKLGRVEVFRIAELHSRWQFLWDHLQSLLCNRVFTLYRYQSRAFRERLSYLLACTKFDLVHVDSLDLCGYLPLLDNLPVVCVHHNVESQLLTACARAERSPWRRVYIARQSRLMEEAERWWCPRVTLNITVSEQDAASLTRVAPGARYVVVPNGVDTSYFVPNQDSLRGRDGLVFVGSNTWLPNRDALSYFCTDILPLIRQAAGPVSVHWVGVASEDERRRLRNRYQVEVTGYVTDVRPYVAGARCYIVPLRIGGGSRVKILDAWAMRAAVVSTSVGCAGLGAVHGENILIADTPRDFAAAVLRILEDDALRQWLGENGRTLVERQYSWSAIGRGMIGEYLQLLEPEYASLARTRV